MPTPPPYFIPPAGVSPAGFAVGNIFGVSKPPGILADRVDATTGEFTSLFLNLHPVDAALQHQLAVRRASGAAVNGGQDFEKVRKNDSGAQQKLIAEIARIAKRFTDRGWISVVSIAAEAGESMGDNGAVMLVYRNRFTNAERKLFA